MIGLALLRERITVVRLTIHKEWSVARVATSGRSGYPERVAPNIVGQDLLREWQNIVGQALLKEWPNVVGQAS